MFRAFRMSIHTTSSVTHSSENACWNACRGLFTSYPSSRARTCINFHPTLKVSSKRRTAASRLRSCCGPNAMSSPILMLSRSAALRRNARRTLCVPSEESPSSRGRERGLGWGWIRKGKETNSCPFGSSRSFGTHNKIMLNVELPILFTHDSKWPAFT